MLDDLYDPVFLHFQVFAIFAVSTEQTSNVRVLGGLGFSFNVFGGDTGFFSVEHGVAHPAHDGQPLVIAVTHDRAQRFLGNGFRQNHVVLRRGQLAALGEQLGLVGGQHVATTGFQRLGAFIGGVEGDRGVLEVVATEVVGNVQLGGGTGLDADGCTVEFLGTFDAQLVVNQEADAVVISDEAREFQTHARIAGAGHGGVTRQDVDFAGLKRGETLLGVQLAEFDLGCVTENSGGHSTANVSIDPEDLAAGIRYRETRQAVTHATLHKAFLLHGVQGGAGLGETTDTQYSGRGYDGQGGFQYLHSNLQLLLLCRSSNLSAPL